MRRPSPPNQDDLLTLVKAFTTRPLGQSDETPPVVTSEEIAELGRIISVMIDLHWGLGGPHRPVDFRLIDRTRFEEWPWRLVPLWSGIESLDALTLAILQNTTYATKRLAAVLEFAEARRRSAERADREAATALMKTEGDDPPV